MTTNRYGINLTDVNGIKRNHGEVISDHAFSVLFERRKRELTGRTWQRDRRPCRSGVTV